MTTVDVQIRVLCFSLLAFWTRQLFVMEVHRFLAVPPASSYPTDSINTPWQTSMPPSLSSVSRREDNLRWRTSFTQRVFSHLESYSCLFSFSETGFHTAQAGITFSMLQGITLKYDPLDSTSWAPKLQAYTPTCYIHAGVNTQGLVHTGQALFPLSYISSSRNSVSTTILF